VKEATRFGRGGEATLPEGREMEDRRGGDDRAPFRGRGDGVEVGWLHGTMTVVSACVGRMEATRLGRVGEASRSGGRETKERIFIFIFLFNFEIT
jgi:hypothetical protein